MNVKNVRGPKMSPFIAAFPTSIQTSITELEKKAMEHNTVLSSYFLALNKLQIHLEEVESLTNEIKPKRQRKAKLIEQANESRVECSVAAGHLDKLRRVSRNRLEYDKARNEYQKALTKSKDNTRIMQEFCVSLAAEEKRNGEEIIKKLISGLRAVAQSKVKAAEELIGIGGQMQVIACEMCEMEFDAEIDRVKAGIEALDEELEALDYGNEFV
jgi:hypothetical protein